MSTVAWLSLGLTAEFIASRIVNKPGEGPILVIVLGIVGPIVGGFLFSYFGATGVTGVNFTARWLPLSARSSCLWSTTRSSAEPPRLNLPARIVPTDFKDCGPPCWRCAASLPASVAAFSSPSSITDAPAPAF